MRSAHRYLLALTATKRRRLPAAILPQVVAGSATRTQFDTRLARNSGSESGRTMNSAKQTAGRADRL